MATLPTDEEDDLCGRQRAGFVTRRGRLALIFTLSGACGLGYELVWLRLSSGIFGDGGAARATVLALFLGGLGLGSYLAARRIARGRIHHPLWRYAQLELGIALWAVLVPWLAPALASLYAALHPGFSASSTLALPWLSLGRALLAALLLLPATTAMGATLPLLVADQLSDHGGPEARVGPLTARLYAFNTFGAAMGVLATGLWLAPILGWYGTSVALAALNVTLGLGALHTAYRSAGHRGEDRPPEAARARPVVHHPGAWSSAFALGAAGLGLELVWMRALDVFSRNTALAHTAILAVYIVGLALGAWLLHARGHGERHGWAVIGALTLLAAAHALLGPGLLAMVRPEEIPWGSAGIPYNMGLAAALALPGTLASGAALPRIVTRYARRTGSQAAATGHIYAANTLGAVVGALVTGWVIVPTLGSRWALIVAASLLMGVAIYAWLRHVAQPRVAPGDDPITRAPWAVLFGAMAMPVVIYGGLRVGLGDPALLYPARDATLAQRERVIFTREDTGVLVEVGEDRAGRRTLRTDRSYAWGSQQPAVTRTMLRQGSLPLALHPEPRRVLELGLATGVQFLPILATRELEHGRIVEISPAIAEAATLFYPMDGGLDSHPRFDMVLEDGRSYLAADRERWDVIVLGLFTTFERGVGELYTRELYATAHERLRPGGIVVQWIALDQISTAALRSVVAAFIEQFPDAIAFERLNYLALVGGEASITADLTRLRQRMDAGPLGPLLDGVGLRDPAVHAAGYFGDRAGLVRFAGDSPPNTAARGVVEWTPPTHRPGSYRQASENLRALLELRAEEMGDRLRGASVEERAEVEALRRARRAMIEGAIAEIEGRPAEARALFRDALREGPRDPLIAEQGARRGRTPEG